MVKKINILSVNSSDFISSAVSSLEKKGVVIIRGLFTDKLLQDLQDNWHINFQYPAVSGTIGYYKTSQAKASLPLFLLGRPAIEVALEKKVISIIEKVMRSNCTLAEANAIWHKATKYVYFPVHSDFAVGWKKSKDSIYQVSKDDIKHPIGIGAMLYLHNTKSGAFKYSLGSHKLNSKYGQHLKNYPKEIKDNIKRNMILCDGKKGDLILFDDRGFHGPDQPSKKDRNVILLDYYRNKTFGSVVVAPHIVKITDIGFLNRKQLNVLGLGASEMIKSEDYVGTRFKKNSFFNIIVFLIKNSYFFNHLKANIKYYKKKFFK